MTRIYEAPSSWIEGQDGIIRCHKVIHYTVLVRYGITSSQQISTKQTYQVVQYWSPSHNQNLSHQSPLIDAHALPLPFPFPFPFPGLPAPLNLISPILPSSNHLKDSRLKIRLVLHDCQFTRRSSLDHLFLDRFVNLARQLLRKSQHSILCTLNRHDGRYQRQDVSLHRCTRPRLGLGLTFFCDFSATF